MSEIIDRARAFREKIEEVLNYIPEGEEDSMAALFSSWKVGVTYAVDDKVRYNDKVYRCVQAHTSQADWTPDATPALWTHTSTEEWPEWVQPTGAQDAYNTGDKVTYNGQHYISTIDGNVWAPDAYPAGWQAAD